MQEPLVILGGFDGGNLNGIDWVWVNLVGMFVWKVVMRF